jgi:hypothetical protein
MTGYLMAFSNDFKVGRFSRHSEGIKVDSSYIDLHTDSTHRIIPYFHFRQTAISILQAQTA